MNGQQRAVATGRFLAARLAGLQDFRQVDLSLALAAAVQLGKALMFTA